MLTGLGCPLSAFALGGAVAAEVQGVQISGRVVDTKGEPLIGVNVVIVGTTTGVSTDINGKYVIRGVPVGCFDTICIKAECCFVCKFL